MGKLPVYKAGNQPTRLTPSPPGWRTHVDPFNVYRLSCMNSPIVKRQERMKGVPWKIGPNAGSHNLIPRNPQNLFHASVGGDDNGIPVGFPETNGILPLSP